MSQKIDVRALASLARLEVTDGEVAKLESELPDILDFVNTIQKAVSDAPEHEPTLINVVRPDTNPHEGGMYTEGLLKVAPAREKDYIAVKQVLTRKNK